MKRRGLKPKKLFSYLGRLRSIFPSLFLLALLFSLYQISLGPVLERYLSEKLIGVSYSVNLGLRNNLTSLSISDSSLTLDQRSSLLLESDLATIKSNTSITTSDPRVLAVQKFLIDYHSPLYTYAEDFVSEADQYGLDWRLVVSISGVESAFGNLIPYRTNNGWGWKGGPNGNFSIFTSWKEGIATVTRRLALGYGTTLSPFDIEPTYCPPCAANPAHAWANGVTKFMQELQFYLDNLESL